MVVNSGSNVKQEFYKQTKKPRFLKPNPQGIPSIIKPEPIWILWSAVRREYGWTKVPLQLSRLDDEWIAKTGRYFAAASANNPRHGWTFDEVWKWYERYANLVDGVGLFLRGGLFGVDLDNSIRNQGIATWAKHQLKVLNTYSDVSPSGTGLKCLLYASMAEFRKLEQVAAIGAAKLPQQTKWGAYGGEVEIYDASSPRFFTLTGHPLLAYPRTIAHNQEGAELLYLDVFEDRLLDLAARQELQAARLVIPDLDDDLIISMLQANEESWRLWNGEYENHSEADLALCSRIAFYTGPDAITVDRIFRCSALMRPKWEREDYRRSTLDRAIQRDIYYDWTDFQLRTDEQAIHDMFAAKENWNG